MSNLSSCFNWLSDVCSFFQCFPIIIYPRHLSSNDDLIQGRYHNAMKFILLAASFWSFALLTFQIPNFFTAFESNAFIEVAESLGFTHQGSRGPAYGEAYRDNHRISVSDPVLGQSIWEAGLKRIFDDIRLQGKVAIGLNPNIRFYRWWTNFYS